MKSKSSLLVKTGFLTFVGIVILTRFQGTLCSPSPQSKRGGSRRGNSQGYGKYDEKAFQEQIKPGYHSKVSSKLFVKKHWQNAIAFGSDTNVSSDVAEEMQESLKSNEYLGEKVNFDEWKAFVKQDGWLCRDDKDCVWYDLSLGCDDREFNSTNVEADWPWKDDLKGRCTCQKGFWFDQELGKCAEVRMNWLYTLIIIGAVLGSCFLCSFICQIILRITRKLDLGQD